MAYADLYMVLSGGGSNVDPNASLGGAASITLPFGIFSPQKFLYGGIPGIQVCAVRNAPLGLGYMFYDPVHMQVTWIPYGTPQTQTSPGPGLTLLFQMLAKSYAYGNVRYDAVITEGGLMGVGTGHTAEVLLLVTLDNLPTTPASTTLDITNQENLFDDVSSSENTAGDTEYRCLWIKNGFTEELTYLKIEIASQPTECVVGIANEYVADSVNPPNSSLLLAAAVDTEGAFLISDAVFDPIADPAFGWRTGAQMIGANGASQGDQVSDGTTGDLPVAIVDESDSTNLVSGLTFDSIIEFKRAIPPGGMRSFWIKRVKSPGAVGATNESFSLNLDYIGA